MIKLNYRFISVNLYIISKADKQRTDKYSLHLSILCRVIMFVLRSFSTTRKYGKNTAFCVPIADIILKTFSALYAKQRPIFVFRAACGAFDRGRCVRLFFRRILHRPLGARLFRRRLDLRARLQLL